MLIKLIKEGIYKKLYKDRQEKCTVEKKQQNALQIVTAELLFLTLHTQLNKTIIQVVSLGISLGYILHLQYLQNIYGTSDITRTRVLYPTFTN